MLKIKFPLIAALALLVLILAACGGTTPDVVVPMATQQVPQTGATLGAAAGDISGVDGCVSVDTQALMLTGEVVYADSCAGCHGEQGIGVGDFPGLTAGSLNVEDVTGLVTRYFSVEGHPTNLSEIDVAGVFTYVRSSFGNTGSVICPEDLMLPVP
jgi:mono/diheme cytochrome c family protein